jgi:hypothetical protein
MKPFTDHDVARARAAAEEISTLLVSIDATDHPAEKSQRTDLLRAYIAPSPGHSLANLAAEILDGKIERTKQSFLQATQPFYRDQGIAARVAEECGAITELQHRRNSLGGSPSIEQANQLLETFNEFLASPAARATGTHKERFSDGEESPDESAPAAATGHTHEQNRA